MLCTLRNEADLEATFNLAQRLLDGLGVTAAPGRAVRLLRELSAGGHAKSSLFLAELWAAFFLLASRVHRSRQPYLAEPSRLAAVSWRDRYESGRHVAQSWAEAPS